MEQLTPWVIKLTFEYFTAETDWNCFLFTTEGIPLKKVWKSSLGQQINWKETLLTIKCHLQPQEVSYTYDIDKQLINMR